MPSAFGKEQIAFFEILQPQCSRTYGTAPCAAVLGTTGAAKCYNTRSTCQDSANYAPTDVVTLRFVRPQDAVLKWGNTIPSLRTIATTPASVNLGGMDKNISALGNREVVTVTLGNHRHSDHQLDKYRLERISGAASSPSVPFDPYTRGTFWHKWLARNPYYVNYRCRVRIGTADQALADMTVRNYILDSIDGPDEDGTVTIVAKDLLSRLETTRLEKAVAPKASRGALSADLTGSPASFTLVPSGIGNLQYPAAGWARIGEEDIQFTRSGDVCTIVARGAFNTTAVDHKQEDLVQLVLRYQAQRAHDIVYDLMLNYGALDSSLLPKAQWDLSMASITSLYTANITEPTSLQDLIGELSEQVGFTTWHDPVTDQVQMVPLRAAAATSMITDDVILARSGLRLKKQSARRASQVWVYYAQIDPNKSLENRANYRSRLVSVDLGSEGQDKYGTPAIREIFSRWIPQFGQSIARDCSDRLLTMFLDPPVEAQFRLHSSKEGTLELARYFEMSVSDILDELGNELPVAMATLELERDDDELAVRAQSVSFGIAPAPAIETVIALDSDAYNIVLRDVYDLLYTTPNGTEVITFEQQPGVAIGSTSSAQPALRTGTWPAGVTLKLRLLAASRIEGRGGEAGNGGQYPAGGANGASGGPALQADRALTVENYGLIWAGGGGGGGGGAGLSVGTFNLRSAGGGGGGGAGRDGGNGGAGGDGGFFPPSGPGSPGSPDAGGAGGAGNPNAGSGGAGGNPGEAGQNGSPGNATGAGLGAGPGNYIVGNANVTWLVTGDRRGGVS